MGSDDGYQAKTGHPVIRHSLPYRFHHLVVLASDQPLCLVLTHCLHYPACFHVSCMSTCLIYVAIDALAISYLKTRRHNISKSVIRCWLDGAGYLLWLCTVQAPYVYIYGLSHCNLVGPAWAACLLYL
jgi:hypothetical protein